MTMRTITTHQKDNKKKFTPQKMNDLRQKHHPNQNKTNHVKKHLATSWDSGMWTPHQNEHLMMDLRTYYTTEPHLRK